MGDSLLLNVQRITSCASFARMSGVQLPVMTTTGSGNQGITLILTVAATAMELGVPEEKMLRAIAFAQAINLYAKHYLGRFPVFAPAVWHLGSAPPLALFI